MNATLQQWQQLVVLTCSTHPGWGSGGDGDGSTVAPGPVSGSAARHFVPAAWPGADALLTLDQWGRTAGAGHGKERLEKTHGRWGTTREKGKGWDCHCCLSLNTKMSITFEFKRRKKLNKYMDEEPSPHRTAVGVAPRCQWGGDPGWGWRVWLLGRGVVPKETPRPTGPSGGEPRPSLDANDVMRNTGYIK